LQDVLRVGRFSFFYVYGSVHRRSILLIVQRDATQSSIFIILQVHSTCFGCQTHPSSAIHKTVTTASVTGHILCAATSLQRGQSHPTSGEHKTVTTASVTGTPSNIAKLGHVGRR